MAHLPVAKREDQLKQLVIKHEGETYSLLEIPKSTTKLVVSAKQYMTKNVDLPQLAKDLSNLGKLLRLAFHGVVGHDIELQKKVRKLFYDVVDLSDESVRTINEFQSASDTAVRNLKATYKYLVDGLDDLAIVKLKKIAEDAEDMKKAADHLAKKYRDEAKIVRELQAEASEAEDKSRRSSEEKEKQRRIAEAEREKQQRIHDDMVQTEMKAEKEYEEARRKEAAEIDNQKLGLLKGMMNTVFGAYKQDCAVSRKAAEIHGKDKEMYYDDMIKSRAKRRVALEEIASFAKKMEQLSIESKLESAAAESLHHADTALLNLADIMSCTSEFWKGTADMCKKLCSSEAIEQIKIVSGYDDEKRRQVYDDEEFKLSGIKYYGTWVAIKEICETCRDGIKNSQREVHAYIRENPTKEEARTTVQQLAGELQEIIQQDIAAHERSKRAIQN